MLDGYKSSVSTLCKPLPSGGRILLTRGRDWPENPSTLFKKNTFMWKQKRASDQMGISHTRACSGLCCVVLCVREEHESDCRSRTSKSYFSFFGLKSIKRHSDVLVYNFQAKDVLQYGQKLMRRTSRLCSLWVKLPKQAENNGSDIFLHADPEVQYFYIIKIHFINVF